MLTSWKCAVTDELHGFSELLLFFNFHITEQPWGKLLIFHLDETLYNRSLSPRTFSRLLNNAVVPIYTTGCREALWDQRVSPKNKTQWYTPGLVPLDPEPSALTMRPPVTATLTKVFFFKHILNCWKLTWIPNVLWFRLLVSVFCSLKTLGWPFLLSFSPPCVDGDENKQCITT